MKVKIVRNANGEYTVFMDRSRGIDPNWRQLAISSSNRLFSDGGSPFYIFCDEFTNILGVTLPLNTERIFTLNVQIK